MDKEICKKCFEEIKIKRMEDWEAWGQAEIVREKLLKVSPSQRPKHLVDEFLDLYSKDINEQVEHMQALFNMLMEDGKTIKDCLWTHKIDNHIEYSEPTRCKYFLEQLMSEKK